MELIYICSPYRGDKKKNVENAKKYCKWIGLGEIPIAPHLYFTQFLDEDLDRWKGLYWGKCIMKYCSEIRVFCNELTEGMIDEIEEAKKLKLKMTFYNTNREEINNANYLIHTEIGPAYRRVIAEHYGDRFYFEGCGDCRKCGKDDGEVEVEREPEPEKQPERRSFWDRFFGSKA
jgi:hypothetical protein